MSIVFIVQCMTFFVFVAAIASDSATYNLTTRDLSNADKTITNYREFLDAAIAQLKEHTSYRSVSWYKVVISGDDAPTGSTSQIATYVARGIVQLDDKISKKVWSEYTSHYPHIKPSIMLYNQVPSLTRGFNLAQLSLTSRRARQLALWAGYECSPFTSKTIVNGDTVYEDPRVREKHHYVDLHNDSAYFLENVQVSRGWATLIISHENGLLQWEPGSPQPRP